MTPTDKLAMMANQIAQFFKAYPHDQAIAGIAHHIEAFWTPKMRKTFTDGMAEAHGVDPLVIAALSPKTDASDASHPIEKVAAGPGKLGEAGAVDAG